MASPGFGGTRQAPNKKTKLKGGYECTFVEGPPKFQTECRVCLLVLRSTHLVTCCGQNFCEECIQRVQSDGKSCPLCNASGFTATYNRAHDESLKQLEVYCTHQDIGCVWKGKLELLDKHLNVNPHSENQLEGCDFVVVQCRCGESFKRCRLETHLDEKCPLEETECDFKHIGCDRKLRRNERREHLKEIDVHMSLLARQNEELKKKLQEQKRKIERITTESQIEIAKLKTVVQRQTHTHTENQQQLKKLAREHQGDMETLERKNRKQIEQVRDRKRKQDVAKAKLETRMRGLKQEFNMTSSSVKNRHQTDIFRMEQRKDEQVKLLKRLKRRIIWKLAAFVSVLYIVYLCVSDSWTSIELVLLWFLIYIMHNILEALFDLY